MTRDQSIALPIFFDVVAGDIDNDGDIDLMGVGDLGRLRGPNLLLLNDGRGGFTPAPAGQFPSVALPNTSQIDLADVDGDGDLDCLTVGDLGEGPIVYRNVGGNFTDVTATALPGVALPQDGFDQVVADLDGDGDVDWLVIDALGVRFYGNNGAGVFTDVSATLLAALPQYMPASFGGSIAIDLEGDGDLDVVFRDHYQANEIPEAVLLNQGGGRMVASWVRQSPPSSWQVPATLADFDGDGAADVLLRSNTTVQLLLGSHQLTYADVTSTNVPIGATGIAPHLPVDVDGDGDIDLVGDGVLWLNDGTGVFVDASSNAPFGLPMIAADLDGDGDQDLLTTFGVQQSTTVQTNFLRQIESRSDPIRGQNYSVEFWVPPGPLGSTLLAAAVSLAGAVQPLGELGILRLDLSQAALLPWLIGGGSPQVLTFAIPNDPQLAGVQVHFQGELFDVARAPHLTNLLVDTVQ